ncbi:MAG: 5-formyltetrahydrofolate cyclo-ligase [Thermodesulfobacteriota bacterium]
MRADLAKEHLRKKLLEMRRELTFEAVWARSAIIQKNLVDSPLFKEAQKIALYSSCENEVLTDDIFLSASLEKKDIYYPRVFKGAMEMRFLSVSSLDELSPGAYDIREPGAVKVEINPGELDLIVLPGVAFDTNGARLGFGKGYYDRALSDIKCPLAALAYDFQIMDSIPREAFDVSMDYIITDKGLIRTSVEEDDRV